MTAGAAISDSGVDPYSLVIAAKDFGICLERDWPYDPWRVNAEPTPKPRIRAQCARVSVSPLYAHGERLWDLVRATLAQSVPVMLAIETDEAFRSCKDATPIGPPKDPDGSMTHAITLHGYEGDVANGINSWGLDFGVRGLFRMTKEAVGAAVFAAAVEELP